MATPTERDVGKRVHGLDPICGKALGVEAVRVLYDHYHSPAMGQAIEAQALTADLIREKQEQTKKISERLRLDWEAQDKAYKEQASAKK